MTFSEVSLLLLAVLMVAIQVHRLSADRVPFLDQTRQQSGIKLQRGYSLSNLGHLTASSRRNDLIQGSFHQKLQSVPLQLVTASKKSQGSIRIVDPELLGPNEGLGHDSPLQFQKVFKTGIGVSSRTLSNRNDLIGSTFSLPSIISQFRGPTRKVFRITGNVVSPLIVPSRFNRLPKLGGNRFVTQSSFLHQLTSIPLHPNTASGISLGNIRTVGPELLGPNEGHDLPHEFQNVLATGIGLSSRTLSNRVDPPGSLYSLPGGIFPIRDPKQEDFRITGYVALPIIVPNGFNRIPELGEGKDVTQSSFHQQLQSIHLQSKPASSISFGIIHSVDPEIRWPIKGIISDDSPHEFQNSFATKIGDEDGRPGFPYSLTGRTSLFRGPNGEAYRITGDVALSIIVSKRFNRLPKFGGNGYAVTSSGEHINTLVPGHQTGPGRQRGPLFGTDN